MSLYKKSLLIVIIVTFIFAVPVKSLKSQVSEDPDEIVMQGLQKLNEAKLAEAEKLFKKALKLDKFKFMAYYYLAVVNATFAKESENEETKKQFIAKALKNLEYAVSAVFRDSNQILRDKRLDQIRTEQGYVKISRDLDYLTLKESTWRDVDKFIITLTTPEEEEDGEKLPMLLFLKSDDTQVSNAFKPGDFPTNNKMVTAEIAYSTGSSDIFGGRWTEYTEKRIRKTLEHIRNTSQSQSRIDFGRVYLCGVRQAGYRAILTYLEYPNDFAGVFTFDTPMFQDSDAFDKLKDFKTKDQLRIYAVHSKKDSLGFADSEESWKKLVEFGVPAVFKVEEDLIFTSKVIEKYEKIIFEFLNKELPKIEKPEDKPQTQPNKSDEQPQTQPDKPEEKKPETDEND